MKLKTLNPLSFTQGDTVTLALIATDDNDVAVDLTGASFTTEIAGAQGAVVSFPNAQHTINSDQVTYRGYFYLSLSSVDTAACAPAQNKDILTQISFDATFQYYIGRSLLNVNYNVPSQ